MTETRSESEERAKEARAGPSVWGRRFIDRVGLVGLIVASTALAVVDFALALRPWVSPGLTIAETVLLVPWALVVFRYDRRDLRRRRAQGWPAIRVAGVHAVNVVLLGLCLWQKWDAVLAWRDGAELVLSQYRAYTVAAYVLAMVGLLGRGSRIARLLLGLSERPARLTTLSFGVTGLFGALLLNLPVALRNPADASFVDALFTAVSAVCVTGLVVHPTAATYTPFGQVVILVLFQAGGLGIMALSSAFAIMAGRRLRVRSTAMLAEIVDAKSLTSLRRTVLGIVTYTLIFEAIGTLVLFGLFQAYPETAAGVESSAPLAGAGNRLWAAAFHSVSAFCNAGFTVFRANALPFAGSWPVSLTLGTLIVVGGFGFPVLSELFERARTRIRRRRLPRMSLHSRVVLITSGLLVVAGALMILALEWNHLLAGRPWDERILTSLFQSVTARTAGFNTLPIGALAPSTLMLLSGLMFVGASPGSTGGGVKTSTLAVLYATFRAELTGWRQPSLLDRTVPQPIVRRALGVFFLSVLMVGIMNFLLLITEPHPPIEIAFEAFSAFSTVGLSTGITPTLSTPGKLLITLTMFAGRIGPLTLALALAARDKPRTYGLPEERVIIG